MPLCLCWDYPLPLTCPEKPFSAFRASWSISYCVKLPWIESTQTWPVTSLYHHSMMAIPPWEWASAPTGDSKMWLTEVGFLSLSHTMSTFPPNHLVSKAHDSLCNQQHSHQHDWFPTHLNYSKIYWTAHSLCCFSTWNEVTGWQENKQGHSMKANVTFQDTTKLGVMEDSLPRQLQEASGKARTFRCLEIPTETRRSSPSESCPGDSERIREKGLSDPGQKMMWLSHGNSMKSSWT